MPPSLPELVGFWATLPLNIPDFTHQARSRRDQVVGQVPGLIVCVQPFGSVAHRHPHLHVLMTDGAFRRDGTFVRLPEPETAVLEAAWRRSVLAEFVRRGWLEEDAAVGMLGWPHSGFGAYPGPRIEEREGLLRVARYSARSRCREHPRFEALIRPGGGLFACGWIQEKGQVTSRG